MPDDPEVEKAEDDGPYTYSATRFSYGCAQCDFQGAVTIRSEALSRIRFHMRNHEGHRCTVGTFVERVQARPTHPENKKQPPPALYTFMCETCNRTQSFLKLDAALDTVDAGCQEHRAYILRWLKTTQSEYFFKTKAMDALLPVGAKNFRMVVGVSLEARKLFGLCCPHCNLVMIYGCEGRDQDPPESFGFVVGKKFAFPRIVKLGYDRQTGWLHIAGEGEFPHYCPELGPALERMQTKLLTEPPSRKVKKERVL